MFTYYDKLRVLYEYVALYKKRKTGSVHVVKVFEEIICDYESAKLNMEIKEAKTHGGKK